MQELIASYLIQNKECVLPLLGHFHTEKSPAILEVAEKVILPPTTEIGYSENGNYIPGGLASYIAGIQHISWNEADEKINNWCLHTRVKLDAGEKIYFDSVGSIYKINSGDILFEKEQPVIFFEPVSAERVIHKNEEHPVLVGDKETTTTIMNEFFKEEKIDQKSSLFKWAMSILIITVALLIIYFTSHSFSEKGIGNQNSIHAFHAPSTYYLLK